MSLSEKIKEKAKTGIEISREKNFAEAGWIRLYDALALLEDQVVVPKQKWKEFEKLLKTRPKFYSFEANDRLRQLRDYFEVLEKKLEELLKE